MAADPTRAMLDRGLHWSEPNAVFPKLNFAPAQNFFSDLEARVDSSNPQVWNYKSIAAGPKLPAAPAGKIEIPIWNDELYFEFHRGVFTTQANHKRNMRESEEQLLNAEKYSALAWLKGDAYPGAELTESWKKALLNQFHDLAAGSGIGVIYRDAQHDYDDIRWTTEEATTRASAHLERGSEHQNGCSRRGTGDGVGIRWPGSGTIWSRWMSRCLQRPPHISVLDARGKALPVQILSSRAETNSYHLLVKANSVPSLGYQVLHVVPGTRPVTSDLKASGSTIENSVLRMTVDRP